VDVWRTIFVAKIEGSVVSQGSRIVWDHSYFWSEIFEGVDHN